MIEYFSTTTAVFFFGFFFWRQSREKSLISMFLLQNASFLIFHVLPYIRGSQLISMSLGYIIEDWIERGFLAKAAKYFKSSTNEIDCENIKEFLSTWAKRRGSNFLRKLKPFKPDMCNAFEMGKSFYLQSTYQSRRSYFCFSEKYDQVAW